MILIFGLELMTYSSSLANPLGNDQNGHESP